MKEAFSAWKIAPPNVKNSDPIRHKKIKKKSEINESKQELMQSIDLKSVMFDVKQPSIKKIQKSISPQRPVIPIKQANQMRLQLNKSVSSKEQIQPSEAFVGQNNTISINLGQEATFVGEYSTINSTKKPIISRKIYRRPVKEDTESEYYGNGEFERNCCNQIKITNH